MTTATTFLRGRIALHGTTPLYDRKNLEQVLDVLDTHGFAPAKAGLDERDRKPYTREAALGLLSARPTPYEQTDLYIWGSKRAPYSASLALWNRAYVGINFEPTPPASMWAGIFELADALAAVFQPDWGAVGIDQDLRDDLKREFANDDERDLYLVGEGVGLLPKDYIRRGPHGLAPRTYIGPFFAEQFGRDRIESLPLIVDKLSWGGYRVDLASEPWAAEIPAVLDGWRRGMAHLRDANIFPTPEIKFGYAMRWTRGTRIELRP
jgi:hypothetical protein